MADGKCARSPWERNERSLLSTMGVVAGLDGEDALDDDLFVEEFFF